MFRRVEEIFHTFSTLNCMTVGQLQASVGLSGSLRSYYLQCIDTVEKSVGTSAPCHWMTGRAVLRVSYVADSVARICTSVGDSIPSTCKARI